MKRRWLFLVAICAALVPPQLAAQGGTITGQVVDQSTQRPLSGVQITVSGTQTGTLTNQQGQFVLPNVPAGPREIGASQLGYGAQTETVDVVAGQSVSTRFELAQVAVELDAVVVTATGEQRTRELANAVSNISADEVVRQAPITSVSELLTGRAAGVNILQSSGTTGTNARIRIRGSNSISLNNEPIIFLDGIRISNNQDQGGLGTGGQTTSRLNDINPEDIESVEVIKGPSAATLYGTDAANGVIRITTKRGRSGTTRWRGYAERGVLTDPNNYPLNFRGRAGDSNCFAFEVASGSCTQTDLLSFQPLEEPGLSPFGTGHRQQYGLSVSGGAEGVDYYLSGEYEDEVGVLELSDSLQNVVRESGSELLDSRIRPNTLERVTLRANLGAQLAQGLRVGVNTGYTNSDVSLPQNDNNALGIVPSGLLGSFSRETGRSGYGFLLPQEIFAIQSFDRVARFIGSANVNYNHPAAEWLALRGTFGIDNIARHVDRFTPVGEVPLGSSFQGNRTSNRLQQFNYTSDIGATATFQPTLSISSRSSAGVQYFRDVLEGTLTFGEQLGPGSRTVSSAANQFADETTVEAITLGTFVEQQFGWNDRLYVTGALRFDNNSSFGQDYGFITYPKLGVSYVALDEQNEPFFNALNSLRFRLAWGAAGRAPGTTDATRFFIPATATVAGQDVPAVTFASSTGLGNPDLRPERSSEVEAGFDAGLLNGRLGVELTYYNKTTTDALVSRTLAPSLGVPSSRFENLGEVSNRGWEGVVRADLLNLSQSQWDVTVSGSITDNELIALGEGVEPVIFGAQRFQEGFPLGGFFDKRVSHKDADGNGIISADEVEVEDTVSFIGNSFPGRELSIHSGLRLFDWIRVAGLLDYRGDFYQYNFTEEFRCRFRICRGLNDPDATLFEQARATQTVTRGGNRSGFPYIEDASFWKLREASVELMIPDAWMGRFGVNNSSLVITGRNLATWTDYTGLDPELNSIPTANFSARDFLTQAPVRTWIVRLNVGF
jgi:TonB-linked SusC/RagA family outer membrane protein